MTQQFTPPPWQQTLPAAPPPAPAPAAPPPALPQYQIGQVVNGHQLTPTGWVPVPAGPPAAPTPVAPPAWANVPTPTAAPAMGGSLASAFGNVADAETFSKNGFFPADFAGWTKVETVKAICPTKGKNKGQLLIIVEVEVVQSNTATVPQGVKRDQVIKFLPYGEGDMKAVIGAAAGFASTQFEEAKQLQPQHLDALLGQTPGTLAAYFGSKSERERVGGLFAPATLEFICGEKNPLRGRVMGLTTTMNAGKTFTKHNWTPAPRQA